MRSFIYLFVSALLERAVIFLIPLLGYEAVRCVTHRGALLGRVGLWGSLSPDSTHTRNVHYIITVLVPCPIVGRYSGTGIFTGSPGLLRRPAS